jgi:hypothetical protein
MPVDPKAQIDRLTEELATYRDAFETTAADRDRLAARARETHRGRVNEPHHAIGKYEHQRNNEKDCQKDGARVMGGVYSWTIGNVITEPISGT